MSSIDAPIDFAFRPTLREIAKEIESQCSSEELIEFIVQLISVADDEKVDRTVAKALSLGDLTKMKGYDENICLVCALQRT